MKLLGDQQIDELDSGILTHPYGDHFDGLTRVLDEIAVGELWTTGESRTCSSPNCEWNGFVAARANAEADMVPERGLTRSSQGARFEVLMDTDDGPDINNESLRTARVRGIAIARSTPTSSRFCTKDRRIYPLGS